MGGEPKIDGQTPKWEEYQGFVNWREKLSPAEVPEQFQTYIKGKRVAIRKVELVGGQVKSESEREVMDFTAVRSEEGKSSQLKWRDGKKWEQLVIDNPIDVGIKRNWDSTSVVLRESAKVEGLEIQVLRIYTPRGL
jgi:hypothetical protein